MNDVDAQVLECPPNATFEELRSAYLRLAKKFHPDKSNKGIESEAFIRIQKAWEAIVARTKAESKRTPAQEIDLDDMVFDEDSQSYSFCCRCGDQIVASCAALDQNIDTFVCPSCSLRIRVAFEAIEEEESTTSI